MTRPNFIDETGKKYGKLTVVKREQNTLHGTAQWLCQCECGNTKVCRGQDLRSGRKTNCGCEKKPKRITNYFKIKQMTVDEMAKFITNINLTATSKILEIPISDSKETRKFIEESVEAFKQYLLQEVEE